MRSNYFYLFGLVMCTLLAFFGCSLEEPFSEPDLNSGFADGVYVSDFWEVLIRDDATVKYGSIDADWDGMPDCDIPVSVESEMTSEIFTGEIVEFVSYTDYDVYYIKCSSHTPWTANFLGDEGLVSNHENASCIVPLIVQEIDGGVKFAQFYVKAGVLADGSVFDGAITCFKNLDLAKKNVEIMPSPMFSIGVKQ
ncbi:MAG: hypothetical protein IKZ04_01165 [Spirochaetaceae bacterium]|nr:hypothetical protein [Spirochaetaceae bacterium]